jgi:hypothetical protein
VTPYLFPGRLGEKTPSPSSFFSRGWEVQEEEEQGRTAPWRPCNVAFVCKWEEEV